MNWFVIRHGKEEGPYTATQLRQLVTSQRLSRLDLIRREDMKHPIMGEKVKGLFEVPQSASLEPAAHTAAPSTRAPLAPSEKHPKTPSEQPTGLVSGLIEQVTANASPESKEALQRSREALQKSKADFSQRWQETNDKIRSLPGFKIFRLCVFGLLFLLLFTGVIKRVRNAVRTQASREMIQSIISEFDEPLAPELAGINEITSPEALEKLNLNGNESPETKRKLVLGAMRQEVAYRQMKGAEEEIQLVNNAISNATKKGTLSSYDQIPPPVLSCINAGMQVWELLGMPEDNWTTYFVLHNKKIVLTASKANMDATNAKFFYQTNGAGVYWEVGNDHDQHVVESHDQTGFVASCTINSKSEFSRHLDVIRTKYRVTGETWDMQISATMGGFSNEESTHGVARLISKDRQ